MRIRDETRYMHRRGSILYIFEVKSKLVDETSTEEFGIIDEIQGGQSTVTSTSILTNWPSIVAISIAILWALLDVFKRGYGLIGSIIKAIRHIQKRRKILPNIKFKEPLSIEGRPWNRQKWNYHNAELYIDNKLLKSNATNCQARIVYKQRNEDEKLPLKPLAWNIESTVGSYNLKIGNPQSLHVFMSRKDHFGVCIYDAAIGEKNQKSPKLPQGLYDYIKLEVYCDEWEGYKTIKEWPDIEIPTFFEKRKKS